MKHTTIHTDNPIIAEYMGLEVSRKGRKFKHELPPYGYCKIHPDYMKYHLSWDWLMPVIGEIINRIGFKTVMECTEEEWFQSTKISRMPIYTSIEQAHYNVVEYIKWYKRHKFEIFKELCNNK